ncbi:transmembrane protein, putative (macronuclear) [Tetrahymena thermophila SB210]|uniref:Transmembrane protein, putative n=1 Tax=Tetrahymena thermophila (strain SB210) TaxID=312017 RepID=W7X444_TETTS|nr:transmembrane protein, putative [Tetrahymena thermophila SB210]EWS72202.1 transmembrane protein, putative [Tetrahymena thermophila SB210]|eukprot:XP_012655245.1 transmembrane protein, putative [Tetrahymena thermophila SB210]
MQDFLYLSLKFVHSNEIIKQSQIIYFCYDSVILRLCGFILFQMIFYIITYKFKNKQKQSSKEIENKFQVFLELEQILSITYQWSNRIVQYRNNQIYQSSIFEIFNIQQQNFLYIYLQLYLIIGGTKSDIFSSDNLLKKLVRDFYLIQSNKQINIHFFYLEKQKIARFKDMQNLIYIIRRKFASNITHF